MPSGMKSNLLRPPCDFMVKPAIVNSLDNGQLLLHHMKPTRAQPPHAPINLCIEGINGTKISVAVWPTEMTGTHVSGIAEWGGTTVLSSIVSAEGDESEWGQRFLLVWAAVGPTSVRAVPVLGPNQWARARLTLPDINEPRKEFVSVSLTSGDWTARLEVSAQPELMSEQKIPHKLRGLDVGSIAVDMLARMRLGHSWLSGELSEE